MSVYSIKDMERLSNVKAHTIRIWEQRYKLLDPERTGTNIRSYNDAQLRKLLNVCTLIDHGLKISQIASFTDRQIADAIDKIIYLKPDDEVVALINDAIIALASYNEFLFEEVFSKSVEKLGIKDCYLKFIYPLLVRTGLMWSKDDVIPAQEHFLSNLIRKKLFVAIDSLPVVQQADQTWVLFLHEEEKHEIGLLFASYLLRSYGKKVIYLGQEVPFTNLSDVIKECRPTHLYTFFVRNYPHNEIEKLLASLQRKFDELMICVSGQDQVLKKLQNSRNIIAVRDVGTLIQTVNNNDVC